MPSPRIDILSVPGTLIFALGARRRQIRLEFRLAASSYEFHLADLATPIFWDFPGAERRLQSVQNRVLRVRGRSANSLKFLGRAHRRNGDFFHFGNFPTGFSLGPIKSKQMSSI